MFRTHHGCIVQNGGIEGPKEPRWSFKVKKNTDGVRGVIAVKELKSTQPKNKKTTLRRWSRPKYGRKESSVIIVDRVEEGEQIHGYNTEEEAKKYFRLLL